MHDFELFFLRSSEQKIATEMLHYAARLDEEQLTLEQFPRLRIYDADFGRKEGDIGVYAMAAHHVAGAAWVRRFSADAPGFGFVSDDIPELVIAVKPLFRNHGIGSAMLEQLCAEVEGLYPGMSLCVRSENPAIGLYERFGFVKVEGSEKINEVNGSIVSTMVKRFEPVSPNSCPRPR